MYLSDMIYRVAKHSFGEDKPKRVQQYTDGIPLSSVTVKPSAISGTAIGPNHPEVGVNLRIEQAKRVINEYDLYSYDRSAVYAAADLNLLQVDKISELFAWLFKEKRKVFIECDYEDRLDAFDVTVTDRSSNENVTNPTRIGLCVDSHGGGRGRIDVAWYIPLKKSKQAARDEELRGMSVKKQLNKVLDRKQDVDFYLLANGLDFSVYSIVIDANAKIELSYEEFEERYHKDDEDILAFLGLAALEGKDVGTDDLKSVYNNYVTNTFISTSLTKERAEEIEWREKNVEYIGDFQNYLASLRGDVDGEFLYAISMLALLDTKILNETVQEPKWVAKNPKGKGKPDPRAVEIKAQAGLKIVDLNISKEVQRAVERDKENEARLERGETGKRSAPVKHLVRGHFRRLPNGGVSYIKPHFRGQFDTETVTLRRVK